MQEQSTGNPKINQLFQASQTQFLINNRNQMQDLIQKYDQIQQPEISNDNLIKKTVYDISEEMKMIEVDTRNNLEKGNIYQQIFREKELQYYPKEICEESNLRTIKIRFHPTKEQIMMLQKWFGCDRFIYNMMIEKQELFDKNPFDKKAQNYISKKDFIKYYRDNYRVQTKAEIYKQYDFLNYLPDSMKENSDENYYHIIKNNYRKRLIPINVKQSQQEGVKYAVLNFKSKRDDQILSISGRDIKSSNDGSKRIKIHGQHTNIPKLYTPIQDFGEFVIKPRTLKKDKKYIKILNKFTEDDTLKKYNDKRIEEYNIKMDLINHVQKSNYTSRTYIKEYCKQNGLKQSYSDLFWIHNNKMTLIEPLKEPEIIKKYNHEVKIQKTKTGKYYLIIPYDVQSHINTDSKTNASKVTSIDPGISTFINSFSTNGSTKYNDNFIDYSHIKQDRLKSQYNTNKYNFRKGQLNRYDKDQRDKTISYKNKYRLPKNKKLLVYYRSSNVKKEYFRRLQKINRMDEKLQNKTKQFHYDIIKDLFKKYDHIIYPRDFDCKTMKNLCSQSNRKIRSQNHYKFKIRMIYKSQIQNKKIHLIREDYTTQVCSNCFNRRTMTVKDRLYECSFCNIKIDRDINSCINMFLMNVKI